MHFTPALRRTLLIVISCICLAAGAGLLYTQRDVARADRLRSSGIAMLLGMTLLPGATFAARRLERRLRDERLNHARA